MTNSLVRKSWNHIVRNNDISDFYNTLCDNFAELDVPASQKNILIANTPEQRLVASAIVSIIERKLLDSAEEDDHLQKPFYFFSTIGSSPYIYEKWCDCLVKTVQQFYPDITEPELAAWKSIFEPFFSRLQAQFRTFREFGKFYGQIFGGVFYERFEGSVGIETVKVAEQLMEHSLGELGNQKFINLLDLRTYELSTPEANALAAEMTENKMIKSNIECECIVTESSLVRHLFEDIDCAITDKYFFSSMVEAITFIESRGYDTKLLRCVLILDE